MQKTGPLKTVILPVLLVLLLLGLAARLWVSSQEYSFIGPTHITADKTGVYLYASGSIFHLSEAGDLLGAVEIGKTGLEEAPIDLRLLDNGELMIAGQAPASIRLCQPASWTCRELGSETLARLERQFKVLPGRLPGHWLITDARGDALWGWNEAHTVLQERLPPRALAGPNGLAFDDAGHLWIADTDKRRIIEVLPGGEGLWETGREHSAVNDLTIGGRYYPMMLELASDGRWWVIQAAEFSEAQADLVIYDPDAGAVAVVELPDHAYATDLAVLGDTVLVSDMDRFTVYGVDNTTLDVTAFGDVNFHERMQHFQAQRKIYGRLGILSLAAIILAAVLLIITAIRFTPKDRRWSQIPDPIDVDNAAEKVPDIKGIHWLEQNPKMRWMLNGFERIFYSLFALLCLCSALLFAWSCRPGEGSFQVSAQLGLGLLLMCLLVASFIPMVHFSAKALKRRLGSDGEYVHLELDDGRHLRIEAKHLAYNNRVVLYRNLTVPLQTSKWKGLYAEGEIETWLAPLLKDAEKLSEWQLIKRQWKNRDSLLLATAGAIVFMTLVLLVIELLFDR